MKLTLRTQSAKTWDYVYHDDSQLDTVTNPDSDVTDHQYLTEGRLKKIVLDNTATRELFYQDTNDSHAYVANKGSYLRKTLDKKANGTVICSFAYELDAAGVRRSITDKDGKYRAFGYDPKYQLKAETLWTAKIPGTRTDTLLWAYDGNGNRLTQHDSGVLTSYAYGDNSEMTDAGTLDLTYDNFGNTSTISGQEAYTYNFDGCMITGRNLGDSQLGTRSGTEVTTFMF